MKFFGRCIYRKTLYNYELDKTNQERSVAYLQKIYFNCSTWNGTFGSFDFITVCRSDRH